MEEIYPIAKGKPPEYWSYAADCQLSQNKKVYQGFFDLLFPQSCVFCNGRCAAERHCCPDCWLELPWNVTRCRICALPMTVENRICGRCLQQPPAFDNTWAPLRYAFPVAHLVKALKFRAQLHAARSLAALISGNGRPDVDALIAVPLHPRRMRERGYNQAGQIAEQLGRAWQLPVLHQQLQRRTETTPQVGLKLKARQKNVRDAFIVRGSLPRSVGLVDDVMTTGATVNECSRTLRQAGVCAVSVIAAARADAVR